jgi:hypothetical protein
MALFITVEQLRLGYPGDKDIAERWTCQWTHWRREDTNDMAEYKIKGARNERLGSVPVEAAAETASVGCLIGAVQRKSQPITVAVLSKA